MYRVLSIIELNIIDLNTYVRKWNYPEGTITVYTILGSKDGFSLSPGKALERKSARFVLVFLNKYFELPKNFGLEGGGYP